MSEYEKIARDVRKKVSKLTLEQQRQLLKLYEGAIDNLSNKAGKAKDKSLTKRWALDYAKEIEKEKNNLYKGIRKQTIKAVETAAEIGVMPEEWFYKTVFDKLGIDIGPHFSTMFSQIQKGVIEDIIGGGLYKDHKTLSSRIWNISNEFDRNIQYIISQGILEKKSALELARDLEKFVEDPAKRPWSWGKVYPDLRNTKIDYNAQRLARTAINHSYQTASIKSSGMNPFVEGIEWRSAMQHGRTCQLCMDRHGQIFRKDKVPLDHPNGLCTMIPYIPKSLDEVAGELRDWIDGGSNPGLDNWYEKYGEYFATKKIGDSYNFSGNNKANSGIMKTNLQLFSHFTFYEKLKEQISLGILSKEEIRIGSAYWKKATKETIVTPLEKIKSNYENKDRYYHIIEGHKEFLNPREIDNIIDTLKDPDKIYSSRNKNAYLKEIEGKMLLAITKNNIITAFYPDTKYIEKIRRNDLLWEKK